MKVLFCFSLSTLFCDTAIFLKMCLPLFVKYMGNKRKTIKWFKNIVEHLTTDLYSVSSSLLTQQAQCTLALYCLVVAVKSPSSHVWHFFAVVRLLEH